tara:strand:+ start:536 stop:1273 length:738 start_codon:yes stop_codon:yes gene_type:complete
MTATMNYFPTTVIDNFFVEPHKVVDMTKQDNIVWNPATDGSWPGIRSQMVHEINPEFFIYYMQRYLSHFYPWDQIRNRQDGFGFTATAFFQRVPPKHNVPWVHSDFPVRHTIITYLNESFSSTGGTSIYEAKTHGVHMGGHTEKTKEDFYSGRITKEEAEPARLQNNNQFVESTKVAAKFNRTVGFDSSNWHAMHDHNEDEFGEDRLTMITFLHHVTGADYPLTNSKQYPFFWDQPTGREIQVEN